VESPAKAKTINKFLGAQFRVEASMGHVRDLPEGDLGVDIKNNFAPSYVCTPGKERVVKRLEKAARESDTIYLAPDPDREGEAISWHLAEILRPNGKPVHRITFNEITRQAVRRAVTNPGPVDMQLVNAQQARRILDRLVGYKISPLLTRYLAGKSKVLSAGRVQSVALRLICDREAEIRAFVPVEYWTIEALFAAGEVSVSALLYMMDGQRISREGEEKEEGTSAPTHRIASEEEAQLILGRISTERYAVADVQTQKKVRRPPAPYITSTLQQDASRIYGFTGDRTMRAAQALYEGVELGDETVGLITYMRTDSVRVAEEAIVAGRNLVQELYGGTYVPEKPNRYKTKKAAQDAHEAIRPTNLDSFHAPAEIGKYLNSDQRKMYELIWKRFLACQMRPAEYLSTTMDIAGGPFVFRATGSILTFDGYMKVYRDDESSRDQELPHLEVGAALDLREVTPGQHFTRPPARYNDASLIKALESDGIGRPSTYATIVKTLVDREYVVRRDRRFHATELGEVVCTALVNTFPDIFEVGFTAGVEERLDEVEEGKADWVQLLRDFYEPFSRDLLNAPRVFGDVLRQLQQKTGENCPNCGKPLMRKWGRTKWFVACSGYPACNYVKPVDEPETVESDETCEKCGAKMVVRDGRYGPFLACSAYPKCRNARPLPTGIKCPMPGCGGNVVQRRSKRGRSFYGCSNYPKCRFISSDPPVAEPCPVCGAKFLVRKNYKRLGPIIRCARKGCKYSRKDEEASAKTDQDS
jgi:DNA topoisomerase-1